MDNLLEKYAAKVQKLTDQNQHTAAITMIAKYINRRGECRADAISSLLAALNSLEFLHEYYGHLTTPVSHIRNELKGRCFGWLSEEEIKVFNNAL